MWKKVKVDNQRGLAELRKAFEELQETIKKTKEETLKKIAELREKRDGG